MYKEVSSVIVSSENEFLVVGNYRSPVFKQIWLDARADRVIGNFLLAKFKMQGVWGLEAG
jgi:hypothetical protein